MEIVDSNGLLPMQAAEKAFTTAYSFRRFLQKALPLNLAIKPEADPLKNVFLPRNVTLSSDVRKRWPQASFELLAVDPKALAGLPIDHSVGRVELRGGALQAVRVMKAFVKNRLALYPENRNHPDEEGTSGLSPYLHFGHISPVSYTHLRAHET